MSEEQSPSDEAVDAPDASAPETPEADDAPVDVPDASAPETPEADDAPVFNVMSIESVLFDLSDSSPLVHLIEEAPPYRYLAIPIALPEAVALHNALDKIAGRRPGTHELVAEVLRRLNADLVAARIVRYDGGVFYAELDLMTPRGHEILDCRTSDALILAMRQGVRAPVLCAESVLQSFYE